MREDDVRKKIGEENWEEFLEWMTGQTMGIYPDGETNYYEWDVEAFVTKIRTGFDRQRFPLLFD